MQKDVIHCKYLHGCIHALVKYQVCEKYQRKYSSIFFILSDITVKQELSSLQFHVFIPICCLKKIKEHCEILIWLSLISIMTQNLEHVTTRTQSPVPSTAKPDVWRRTLRGIKASKSALSCILAFHSLLEHQTRCVSWTWGRFHAAARWCGQTGKWYWAVNQQFVAV